MDDLKPVSLARRALSYVICYLIAVQPMLPAAAAALTPVTPGTKMDAAGNGVPVVNITAPNQTGVSHNQYQQFNVGKEGLILNNATGQLTQTQLGGLIQNNPNLKAGQEARAIINEVVGANRSQLQGYTEVAGKAANVMVANPYGITCSGCGFINTPNVTLTTGKPQLDASGNLAALEVSKGSVIVEGQGLDGSSADAVAIVARATEINAGIHAKDLSVTTGANRVDQEGSVTPIAGEGAAPAVSVDTGALGGMYANRIHLVSSEKGVGVNLGNLNARQGDMVLDANGQLTMRNSLASGALKVKGESLTLTGDHKAGGAVTLSAGNNIVVQSGSLLSDGDITLNGQSNVKLADAHLTAGRAIGLNGQTVNIDQNSEANGAGNITLSGTQLGNEGQIRSGQQLDITADTLTNKGSLAADGSLTAQVAALDNQGTLQSQQAMSLAGNSLLNGGKIASGGQLTTRHRSLTQNGSLSAVNGLAVAADTLTASSGSRIASEGNIALKGDVIRLAGEITGGDLTAIGKQITTDGSAQLQSKGALQLTANQATLNGTQTAVKAMRLNADALQHGGKSYADELSIEAAEISNSGTLIAPELMLTSQRLSNSGLIQGDRKLGLTASRFDNWQGGTLHSNSDLSLAIARINNQGLITGDNALSFSGDSLTNGGEINAVSLDLSSRSLTNQNTGLMLAKNGLTLSGEQLTNAGQLAAETLNQTKGDLSNTGSMQAVQAMRLQAGTLDNQGTLLSGDTLNLTASVLNNAGQLQADTLALAADKASNTGTLRSEGRSQLQVDGELANSGQILSVQALNVQSGTLANSGSLIAKALTLQGDLLNSGLLQSADVSIGGNSVRNVSDGQILSENTLQVNANTFVNQGKIAAQSLTLTGGALTNSGLLQGTDGLSVTANTVENQQAGRMLTGGDLTLDAGQLTTDGVLQGMNATVTAADWQHNGSLLATGTLDANLSGLLASQGDLMSKGSTDINAGTFNNSGSLLSEGDMTLGGGSLINTGAIQGDNLTLRPMQIDNDGSLTGLQSLTLGASAPVRARMLLATTSSTLPALTNGSQGSLLTLGTLKIKAGSVINDGRWQGQQILLDAQNLSQRGAIQSADALQLLLSDRLEAEANSKITANGTAALQALTLTNAGEWTANNLTLTGNTLTNNGAIGGVNGLTVALQSAFTQQQDKTLLSAGTLTLDAASVNNQGRVQGKSLQITSGQLDNGGRLQGDDATDLVLTGNLNNAASGTILSNGPLTLTTPGLDNAGLIQNGNGSVLSVAGETRNSGRLLNGGTLNLNSASLNNSGWLQATTLLANAATLLNSGTVLAEQQGVLTGNNLTNQGTAQGNNLTVNYQQINNSGTLLGNGQLALDAAQVNQQGNGRLFSGGDLTLHSNGLDSASQIVALGNLALTLANGFSARGVLAAGNTLSVSSNGDIDNQGTLQGNTINLNAGGVLTNNGQITTGGGVSTLSGSRIDLNGAGTLQGGGDVALNSRSDINVNGFTGTRGSMTLTTPGSIVNTALLYAGNNLWLLANSIRNQRGDILAGNNLWMQRDAAGNANGEVLNTSGTVETQNGDIRVNTGHLLNTRDGLSVSQSTTTAPTRAGLGDATMTISIWELPVGSYGYFTTVTTTESGGGCAGADGGCSTHTDVKTYYGTLAESAVQKFALTTGTTNVISNGGAGRFASGHDVVIRADHLENQASNILANGNITLAGNQLENQSWQAGTNSDVLVYEHKAVAGTIKIGEKRTQNGAKGSNLTYKLTGHETEYTPGELYRAVIQAGGNVSANFSSDLSNTSTTANAGATGNTLAAPSLNTWSTPARVAALQKQSLNGTDKVAVSSPQWRDLLQNAVQQVNGAVGLDNASANLPSAGNTPGSHSLKNYQPKSVDTSAYPLPSGDNGYFVISPESKSPYLITLNPKLNGLGQLDQNLFGDLYSLLGAQPAGAVKETRAQYTDEKQFLGSAYLLNRLNLKPDNDYRFLGDAAFDTRYVSNAVLNQTGNRYLGGTGSDLEQMRYLMDNAAATQQSLGLEFGVSLTADQLASLDKSIIWWEAATLNGETVMVPKVYLSPKDAVVQNGSVIAGNNVTLKAGNVTNSSSTLVAQNALALDSQNSIENLNSGLIQAADSLKLTALNSITNVASAISGKTVALESVNGDINNLTTARPWQSGTRNGKGTPGALTETQSSQTGAISATESLSLQSGRDINVQGATLRAGGDLLMSASNDINVTANPLTASSGLTDFKNGKRTVVNNSSMSSQGSDVTAGGSLAMQSGHDLNIKASTVNAAGNATLAAGNDINLQSAETSQNSSQGKSESHSSGLARTTVTSGSDLTLAAGRDLNSQAAGLVADRDVALAAGRDVNLTAAQTASGNSDKASKKTEITESVRQQGTEIASGGSTSVTAGRDVNSEAAQVTATQDLAVSAGRDINLTTATESDYRYKEETKTKKSFLKKTTTHTVKESSDTAEKGTLLSGDNVTLNAGNNLLVKGSAVAGEHDVALKAGNNVDIVAATNTDSSWQLSEKKKSGLMGSGGIGFTIGSSKTRQELKEKGTTQSQSGSTVGSSAGNLSISAGGQAHVVGSDLIAGNNLSLSGDSVVIDPGHDRRISDQTFEQKSSGLTLALSGTVGSAINSAVTTAQTASKESDGRLAALQATKATLSGVQASQAMRMDTSKGNDPANNNTIGVSATYGSQSSKSTSHSEQDRTSGSTLNAGNNLTIAATGGKEGAQSGDITLAGSQLKAGRDMALNAARDITLLSAQDTDLTTGKNESKGGTLGIGIGAGSGGWGISVSASVNSSNGREKGNGVTQNETTLDAGRQLTLSSGRDTTLSGAQASGSKVVADVGRNLTLSSMQDSNSYDSKQTSVSAGGSFTFGSMSGSAYLSANRDKMKSNYDSVIEQSGIFGGQDGFDITVGNHTQLNGAVIGSTAAADKNRLDTGTLGFSDIDNRADYKVQHVGGSFSTGAPAGSQLLSNMTSTLLSGLGSSGHAEGVTRAAVSEGSVVIRDQRGQQQDVSQLSRDVAGANGSISPIFDREKEQKRLQTAQLVGEIAGKAMEMAQTEGTLRATGAGKAELAKKGVQEPGEKATKAEWKAYNDALTGTDGYKNTEAKFGTGSAIQRGIQAATAALQGLVAGNVQGAIAGASAPYLAELIHRETITTGPDGKEVVNEPANLIAHAVLGAVVAQVQNNSALAGATGATAGEFIAQQLYPGVDRDKLSEEQKQIVSELGTLAAGLAGGIAGDSTASAVAGAQAGKNAVENNALSVPGNKSLAQEMAQCQGGAACEKDVIDKYKKINAEQHESVVGCKGAQDCVNKVSEVSQLQADYASRTNELLEKARTGGGLSPAEQDELAVLQVTTIQLETDRNAAIHNALMSGDSAEAKQLAINSLAQAAGTSAAGIGKAGNHSSGIKDNRLPIPEATVANNGFKIESNPKHTPGAPGSRPSAGIEPKNSLSLFENSIATKDPKIRLSIDNDGNIHRFFNTNKDGSGTYHWSGSTGDGKNALGNRELGSFNKEIKELKDKK
ncbi:hemagglutinin repeat-containing protein [Pantoea sp. CCBC3-3-1]|uniref:hemagglutinin repeat-containing protein n=1 Tax=Pantoea sp. CCBC3-3-1 TaxID=2490851 RepID=UPI0011BE22EE|nr:hemagglutinin repeat-containing protein [Pantoea sp. CCBC3-3-1]